MEDLGGTSAPPIAWKALPALLTAGVIGGLLVAAVFVVLAIIAVGEGNATLLWRAAAGIIVTVFAVLLLGRGVTKTKRKAADLAIACHAAAIRFDSADPPDPVALCNRGFGCAMRGEHAKAIAYYDAALQFDAMLTNAYVARVNAYGKMGQWDRVIAEYSQIIRSDPGHALAYCARATAYNGVGRWDLAIPDADAAVRIAQGLYLGYDARGYALLQRGRFHPILKWFAVAWMLATFGFLRRDRFDWRTPTCGKHDLERALADFSEAIRLNPGAWDCYQGRAMVHRALGDLAGARLDEKRVREGVESSGRH